MILETYKSTGNPPMLLYMALLNPKGEAPQDVQELCRTSWRSRRFQGDPLRVCLVRNVEVASI